MLYMIILTWLVLCGLILLFFWYLDIRRGMSQIKALNRFGKALGWISLVNFAGAGLTLAFGAVCWLLVTRILPNEWVELEYWWFENWEIILFVFFAAFVLVCTTYGGPDEFDSPKP